MSEEQDFFFEEEAPKSQESSKGSKASGSGRPSAPRPGASRNAAPAVAENSVSFTNAALIAVVTLLVGVIIGIVLPIGVGSNTGVTGGANAGTSGGNVNAPTLTDEQLNSGTLPEGHPSIGGAGGSGTPTGSATTTP